MTDLPAQQRQRLDKWLWHARVVKTRTLAQKLVGGGKVRVNREKVLAPSAPVRAGDVLTVALRSRVRVLRILAFSERRGPAARAQDLYEDLTPPAAADRRFSAATHPGGQASGRPGKRDRRMLERLKKN